MFIQKFKVCLRFVGILLLRTLLGIVVGYLWLFAVAYLFHIIMDVRFPRDLFDHFYDSGPPLEERYWDRAAEVCGHSGVKPNPLGLGYKSAKDVILKNKFEISSKM